MSTTVALGALLAAAYAQAEIARVQDPAISPDGGTIAFVWQGDIWSVQVAGGSAVRLTVHPSDESFPCWSPDGQTLAFASNRFGNNDVFLVDRQGGNLRRVTFESSSDQPTGFTADSAAVLGYTNAWGRMDLFKVAATGGDLIRLTGHPFEIEFEPTAIPGGTGVLYCQGGAPGNWRKPGHRGSSTAKIWRGELGFTLTKLTPLTTGDYEDLFPTPLEKGAFAFVSNRSGVPNVWRARADGQGLRRLTEFGSGTVRALSASSDGSRLCFQKDSRVWVLDAASGAAKPVAIEAPADAKRDLGARINLTGDANGFAVSPDGKRAVIAARGDLFLVPEKGGTTVRLTQSLRYDGQPQWLDNKTIVYTAATDGGRRQIWKVDLSGKATKWLGGASDMTGATPSPDRKWVAMHQGDREIVVVPSAGGEVRLVATGAFGSASSGSNSFRWSPDSSHIVYATPLARGVSVQVAAIDRGRSIEVARVGKSAGLPTFSSDGRYVAFESVEGLDYSEARDGNSPLVAVRLAPEPLEFSEDDLEAIDAPKPDAAPPSVVIVERGLVLRRQKLGTASVGGVWPGADGKTVFSNVDGQFSTVDLKSGTVKPVLGVTGAVQDAHLSEDKKKLYLLQAGKPAALSLGSGALSSIAFRTDYVVDQSAEELALFEEIWWAMGAMYYDPKLNGKDWSAIRTEFQALVPACQSRSEFYNLMGDMLELLDSSHLGATAPAPARTGSSDDTAWIGIEWDWSALAARGTFRVAKVFEEGPAAHPDSELRVGDVVTSVDGTRPMATTSLASLLNQRAGRKVRLGVDRGGKALDILIRPAAPTTRTSAFYEDWVRWNRESVTRLSGGSLGYVHIQGMDAPSLDRFLREIQTELSGKKGVVVDVRFNGGGFTSHVILNVMRKIPWLVRRNRDEPDTPYSENSYRGNALEMPAACLINAYSFSNAEIFAEGFRKMDLGPIVGEPTAGGVIGTGAYSLWDGGFIRMPGSGAYAVDGENLESNGRKPDFDVRYDPKAWNDGRDPQIERAVRELLKSSG